MKAKEYTITYKNIIFKIDDKQEAEEFWDNLSQQEKENGQFFSKIWIKTDNDWINVWTDNIKLKKEIDKLKTEFQINN
jgi:hypothetical protein